MKYILVTGGVISGVGKGVIASSFGTLLKSCGLNVTSIKIDPYINIDAGTFSPYEHEKKHKTSLKLATTNGGSVPLMAPKKSTIVLNVEQFIRDVQERPAIWNRNFHCNKAFLEQMWDELSTAHKLPKVVLKAKWKGLRDNFRVEYKRIPRSEQGDFLVEPATFESKWIHYYALLFLTDHMRHRMPKGDQDQSYYFTQQSQSQDCEKTVVEPDLTNGLIRRMQDSDEEFDEDDADDDDDEAGAATATATTTSAATVAASAAVAAAAAAAAVIPTPPAAHTNSLTSTTIKTEDARSILKNAGVLLRAAQFIGDDDDGEKEAQDLSKKSMEANNNHSSLNNNCNITSTLLTHSSSPLLNAAYLIGSNTITTTAQTTTSITPPATPIASIVCAANSLAAAAAAAQHTTQQHQKRSVSPPPLYNKAHHPPPTTAAAANALTTAVAAALNKEREEFALNGNSNCLHGSHEHLNFTKHSYANGLIPALKLKRPRLSEDSNFNGSSTMDNTLPLVPEDDDYHYLLSLHPYMRQLTAAQKLRIRTKIQKLIFKELYKEDLEETK
ncbi:uncharacterized protein Ctps isoform X2 [Eurosta solidaginis]|uniref:uncharacterized protein Ctps isoform X2 n=1 Tax=Eurosta solidaginis TaxID=178769 RepID=UPI00353162A3